MGPLGQSGMAHWISKLDELSVVTVRLCTGSAPVICCNNHVHKNIQAHNQNSLSTFVVIICTAEVSPRPATLVVAVIVNRYSA